MSGKAMGITFLYSSSSASRPANNSLSKASSDISFSLPALSLLAIFTSRGRAGGWRVKGWVMMVLWATDEVVNW